MRVAVVGAQGQLGAAIVHELAAAHQVLPLTHRDLDVTKDRDVAEAMTRLRPDAIINCTAFNDVDGAEVRPVEALSLNAFAVRALARAAAELHGILVHFGTDFVFDGRASRPYTEQDRPNPRSAYAVSKLLGEWFAADAPKAYVLRVESLFGRVRGSRPAKGSVAGIVSTLKSGGAPQVFEDRTVSPTYVIDAAAVVRRLIEKPAPFGLYHCVGSGHCTWFEFAQELARQLGVEPRLVPIRMADVQLPAERPQYCALSNDKLRSIGIAIPSWKDALVRYLATLHDEVAHKIANG